MERGCVEDQPQQVKPSESLINSKALRLIGTTQSHSGIFKTRS
jgi:hypothetical protein